ncbi:amidohydrolase family protein [Crinalium epipsammum]|uniref:amidohydrolase family protein n=1 Tax=Crinalium epipsammum TaxID=241425 RepID=UPI000300A17D|nr:amidohydrolase family protein [Crinalium epipsammum]
MREELIHPPVAVRTSDTEKNLRRSHRLRRLLDTYSVQKCQALFQRFVSNNTWKVPTLVVRRVDASLSDNVFVHDDRFRYMSKDIRQDWDKEAAGQLAGATPEMIANEIGWYRKSLELVGKMNQAGVPIMAGSDAGDMYIVPGFHLHDELELLVQAGLTPLQALQAATLNPAKYLNVTAQLGTIAPGKLADLVVLQANPLEDIRNTKKIQAVVLNGKYFDRAALNSLLTKIETLTNK